MRIVLNETVKDLEVWKSFKERFKDNKAREILESMQGKEVDQNLVAMAQEKIRDIPAVKLDISEEGKNWRELVEKLGGRYEPDLSFTPGILSQDYSNLLYAKWDIRAWQMGSPMKEAAADLVRAYGELYDEIVREHESGQREIYVEAPGTEERVRKITLDEELAGLDEAFKKFVKELEWENEVIEKNYQLPFMKEMELRHATGSRKQELLEEKAEWEYRVKSRAFLLPENASEKMAEAVREFVAQYLGGNTRDVKQILANIEALSAFK